MKNIFHVAELCLIFSKIMRNPFSLCLCFPILPFQFWVRVFDFQDFFSFPSSLAILSKHSTRAWNDHLRSRSIYSCPWYLLYGKIQFSVTAATCWRNLSNKVQLSCLHSLHSTFSHVTNITAQWRHHEKQNCISRKKRRVQHIGIITRIE